MGQDFLPHTSMYRSFVFLEEETDDVVEIGVDHQGEEEYHADDLYTLQELVARLAAGDHLEQKE